MGTTITIHSSARMLLLSGQESAYLQKMLQPRHPIGEVIVRGSVAESMPALLVDMDFGGGARSCEIHKQLRGADRCAHIQRGADQKGRREILELLAGCGAARTIDQREII